MKQLSAPVVEEPSFHHGGARRPHGHGIGFKPECDSNEHLSSGTIRHFFTSLFAAAHAEQYAPIIWHRAATAERCIMVMCPLGRSWFRGHWEHENSTAEPRSRLPQRRSALGALGVRMFGRASKVRRNHGAAAMSVECREGRSDICREAARRHQRVLATVSRVSRGRGALAGAQGNGQAVLGPRISHAVVNIADEETEID